VRRLHHVSEAAHRLLGLLSLRDVVQERVEGVGATDLHCADRELHGKLATVAVQRLELDAPAEQRPLAGLDEPLQPAVVR
jgi:hypothetical protein